MNLAKNLFTTMKIKPFIIALNLIEKRKELSMPTVNSKLKTALNEELQKASMELRKDPNNLTACHYYDSIKRLISVCEERKRY